MNNAAVAAHGQSLNIAPEIVEKLFHVNVFGPLFMIQKTAPFMPRGGRIINIGSTVSKMGFVDDPVYAASKAAMDQMTFALSMEVSFSDLCPSIITQKGPNVANTSDASLDVNMGLQSTLSRRVRSRRTISRMI